NLSQNVVHSDSDLILHNSSVLIDKEPGNESQEVLLKEMENWPTFYPDTMDGREIAQEMLLH
ncbi:ZinT/AdcA family metal-binding protein, partial [Enterococcus faecium]|nr:ZinT/AdcA family metal-binding protein [Enterococcus faecium]MCZ1777121.1 ZinT/AdcA family metal-binding protein [Enterococcus faecium]MCZ1791793.1 ZinT/AdcA family metal-binding protein [Enterococcus faecium]MCZ1797676.1 ZinT/AdcA family metal-binding protein [Enterococcus faecium]MCZ1800620.1 ZinT/AdcA family metal-binding protein [Enterococcus faecium]